jgi:hypothetical protein
MSEVLRQPLQITFRVHTLSAPLTPWASPLMDITAICAIIVATVGTRKLIDVLEMITSRCAGVTYGYLSMNVHESRYCGAFGFFWH